MGIPIALRLMGIEATLESPLAEAVRRAGSQSAFARMCGLSQTRVHELLRDGMLLPGKYVLRAESGTGVSRHDLNPEIYPRESGDDAPVPAERQGFGDMAPAR